MAKADRRLDKLEAKIRPIESGKINVLFCSGPRSMSTEEIIAELGHKTTDRTITVRFVVPADQPDLPLADCTPAETHRGGNP